jgi:hypothetical protein
MKKTLILFLFTTILVGCNKDDFYQQPMNEVKPDLQIKNSVGIKLETAFVKSEVSMNVKIDAAQTVTIKIFDISNRVVSKSLCQLNLVIIF